MAHLDPNEETIFHAAKGLADPKAIGDYLDRMCGGNPALRRRIERLLAMAGEAQNFFGRAAGGANLPELRNGERTEQIAPPTPDLEPLPRLGDYQLLEEIARGGMGVVYRSSYD